ncbi:MAG: hypothetical protein IIT89_00340 [Aeriscardovia sp.]|nr:hypothetical protein [Aeriscardovia sp.]
MSADEGRTDGGRRGGDDSKDADAGREASVAGDSACTGPTGSDGFSWESFLSDHADEIGGLESSRTARKFVRKAEKSDRKEAGRLLTDASRFDPSVFVVPPNPRSGSSHGAPGSPVGHGPRDFATSWLDAEDVLGRRGGFVPPNPHIARSSMTIVAMTVLLVLGVFGIVASVMVPALSWWLGTVSGALLVLGITGLIDAFRLHRR